jgi:glycyl-tRNA synthetase beta chain
VADRSGELLVEIGFEEMPAPWLPGLSDQLGKRFTEAAGREFLEPTDVQVFQTPRRLVLGARVLVRQGDREEPVWGPSLKVAKDAAGKWTGAAQGFAKKSGVAVEGLQDGVKDPAKPDERYLLFTRKTAGRAAGEVLPAVTAATLRGLNFPKRMSWDAWLDDGKGAFPFGRPIRWLILMLDGTVIPFVIYEMDAGAKGKARVASGPATLGHRFLPKGSAGKPLTIRSLTELREVLRTSFVLLDPAERSARIERDLAAVVGSSTLADDHGLRAEWRDLVEHPAVMAGDIPTEFRKLPREVLETVLVHHQKYIPLDGSDGTLSRFAAVTNGDGAAAGEIVRGMERVVVARLRDAAFFYAEDRKRPLADRVADLAGVTFHHGLGSYLDKTERVAQLVVAMGQQGLLTDGQRKAAVEAARVAKADLTTLMVREFPELQGTMGGIYLQAQDAPAEVAEAVRWQYHPIAVEEGAVPAAALAGRDTRVFAALSLADKLDTLAGYFGLGLNPTGSSDPFGLRRAAQGATRAIFDFWAPKAEEKRPSLVRLIEAAVAGYGAGKRPAKDVARDIESFFLDRMEYVLASRGFPPEEVEAVLHTPAAHAYALEDPLDALARIAALHRVRAQSQDDFAQLAVAFKRAKNILTQQAAAPSIEPALFEHDAERELHKAVASLGGLNGDYDARLKSLSTLRAPVDRFFDDVHVMAEDPKVRGNRLALLNQTLSLFYRIADISRLGGQS